MREVVFIPPYGEGVSWFFSLDGNRSVVGDYYEGEIKSREMFKSFREAGVYFVDLSDETNSCDDVVFFDKIPITALKKLKNKYGRWIYWAQEPLNRNNSVFWLIWISRFVDDVLTTNNRKFKERNIHNIKGGVLIKQMDDMPERASFHDRKLACMVAICGPAIGPPGSLYYLRHQIADYYNQNEMGDCFDLYGKGWDGEKYRNIYRGLLEHKKDAYSTHRFAFSLENHPDVTNTDKLFDSLMYGVVPVGNYSDEFPKDIYVDIRAFEDIGKLNDYLLSVTDDEWMGYIERGQAFLKSELAMEHDVSATVRNSVDVIMSSESIKKKNKLHVFGLTALVLAIKISGGPKYWIRGMKARLKRRVQP